MLWQVDDDDNNDGSGEMATIRKHTKYSSYFYAESVCVGSCSIKVEANIAE